MTQLRKSQSSEPASGKIVRVGGLSLVVPEGLDGSLSDDPSPAWSSLVQTSPERTVYHSRGYLEFARSENGSGDLLVVSSNGAPLFGIPLHPGARNWAGTGYSGLLFPATDRESTLRAAAAAFHAFLSANPAVGFRVEQSAQGGAYASPGRRALLTQLLWNERNVSMPRYTRLLDLTPSSTLHASPVTIATDPSTLDNDILAGYDGDVRNQIRQAIRAGHALDVFVLSGDDAATSACEAYGRYTPMQVESYSRTGMPPHDLDYWLGLSAGVRKGGGTDLVVIVKDASGADVAGVTCHAFNGRALYWSGCSTAAGKAGRANPLALHAGVTAAASLGVTTFEIGRYDASEKSEKELAITKYKSQFRGYILPVANFVRPPQTLRSDVGTFARMLRAQVPRIAASAARLAFRGDIGG